MGEADDVLPPDGKKILSYRQAFEKAFEWRQRLEAGNGDCQPDMTVAEAVRTYIDQRDKRRAAQARRAVRSDAHYKLTAHVLEDLKLRRIRLAELTEADLISWQGRLIS